MDLHGNTIRDLEQFQSEWNNSFEFRFVPERDLTAIEKHVFAQTEAILALIGGRPKRVEKILISETMRVESHSFMEALGLWEPAQSRIVIKRSELRSLQAYAGTLLHEVCHAISGAPDVSAAFEQELTAKLGKVAAAALKG